MSGLKYCSFDPTPFDFPRPAVALMPSLQNVGLSKASQDYVLVGESRPRRHYKRGRYALLDAYRSCGVGSSGALLAPAYHCRTMLDAAIRLSAPVLLYSLHADLAPDFDSLQKLVDSSPVPVRAMLLTHYFGFAQDAARAAAWCAERNISLIEDCSHALFNRRGGPRLGLHGRYTVASPYKLLPCEEGGWLLASTPEALPEPARSAGGWRNELRVLWGAIQRRMEASAARRKLSIPPLPVDEAPLPPVMFGHSDQTSALYLPAEEGLKGSHAANWLLGCASINQAVQARRANYESWARAVAKVPGCRALFPALAPDTAPYMFPLLIDAPQRMFPRLKRVGLPIWRWDEMAVSDCPVSRRYSQALLHLPCHQSLHASELAWMQNQVARVLPIAAAPP